MSKGVHDFPNLSSKITWGALNIDSPISNTKDFHSIGWDQVKIDAFFNINQVFLKQPYTCPNTDIWEPMWKYIHLQVSEREVQQIHSKR